jgi:hypothetical protein
MKLTLINEQVRRRALDILATLPLEPRQEIIIRPAKSKRSLNQNSTYWGWIDAIRLHIMDSTGQAYSKDEVHDFLRAKFLPTRVVEIGGETKASVESTTKLSVKDMSEYMDKIDHYCVQSLGLYLPLPNSDE